MKTILKTATIAALITGFANTANALSVTDTFNPSGITIEAMDNPIVMEPVLTRSAKIGVARLDGGRLIPTPYGEEFDWELLSRRTDANISLLSAGDYLKYIPEIPFDGHDTDNKIDEVRLTAANEGFSHVLIYGLGSDAHLSSFGGKALRETGLSIHEDCKSWDSAKAKALLVNVHTGEVLGAATAENITYNIGELADDVERLFKDLGV